MAAALQRSESYKAQREIEDLHLVLRARSGNRASEAEIIRRYASFVRLRASSYFIAGGDPDDLVQEGMLGLIHAARGFHPNGARFSTYAVACIEGTIRRGLREQGRVVRLPHYLEERLGQVRRMAARLEQTHGRPATDAEVAEALGWSVARVEAVRAAEVAAQLVNLDAPLDGGEGGGLDLASVLVDEGIAPDEVAEQGGARAWVGAVLAELPAREAAVLSLRYGLGGAGPMTLAGVGAQLGCSRQQVEQMEKRALGRLRRAACYSNKCPR
jgi:RNA polymerase sigma factor (sigma-70 family)